MSEAPDTAQLLPALEMLRGLYQDGKERILTLSIKGFWVSGLGCSLTLVLDRCILGPKPKDLSRKESNAVRICRQMLAGGTSSPAKTHREPCNKGLEIFRQLLAFRDAESTLNP